MTAATKNICKELLMTAVCGGLLGAFAKLCDTVPQGRPLGSILFQFGVVSSGVLLWMAVCAWLALRAKCGLHASLSVLSFMVPMLCGYYAWSALCTGYFNGYVVFFWWLTLLPSAALAWILRANRGKRWLRVLGCLAGVAALLFDFVALGIDTPPAFFGEIALLAAMFYLLLSGKPAEKRVPAYYY